MPSRFRLKPRSRGLQSVVPALKAEGAVISIDSFAPEVQRWALAQGVDYLNDIQGFAEPALYPELAARRRETDRDACGPGRGSPRGLKSGGEIIDRAVAFSKARSRR